MNDLIVKNVDVFGDSVLAAKDENGIIWVGIRWMREGLGMTEGQMKRQITNSWLLESWTEHIHR